MELLRVELDRDEPEKKSIREHLGVLYVKGGYTPKEGTLVIRPHPWTNALHVSTWRGI